MKIVSSFDVVSQDNKLVTIQYNPSANAQGAGNYGPHYDAIIRGKKLPGRVDVTRYTKPLDQCNSQELNTYLDAVEAHLIALNRKETSFPKMKKVALAEWTAEKAKVLKLMKAKKFERIAGVETRETSEIAG